MGKCSRNNINTHCNQRQRKKQRQNFTVKAKSKAVLRQKGRCAICGANMNRWEREFHHKDGNKSNNDLCQAVHTRCHRKKHADVHNKDKSLFNRMTREQFL